MSYIGVTPAEAYASFYVQHFTTSATTSYSLDYPVVNENDLRLVVNNVVQQPGSGKAYTAAASTLTLSEATTTSDVMYAVFLGRALQTVNPPAGSVGTSQIEALAVTSAKLAADSVITAKVLDNNVTLAKLADGTQGDILYYGASGAPTLLGFGTSGDFLKTQGTGANPAWATAGGAWTLIETQTASSDSLIEFVDQFSATYDIYKVFVTNVQCSQDAEQLYAQWRQSSSYLTSDYKYAAGKFLDDSTILCTGSTSAAFMRMTRDGTGYTSGGERSSWEITLSDPLGTDNNKGIWWDAYNMNQYSTCGKESGAGCGSPTNIAAMDGIKFYFSAGNIASGIFALYGLSQS